MKKSLSLLLSAFFVFVLSASAFAINAEIPSDTQAVVAKSPTQVTLSGEIRVRLEDASTGATGVQSREQILQRTRLNIAADVVKNTKVFISVQDSRVWGEEFTASAATPPVLTANTTSTGNDTSGVDLSQGYFQIDKIGGQPISLRVGRQLLAYGDQRLIGHLEWSNNARRFDAVKLMYDTKAFSVDLWSAKVLDPAANSTTASNDKDSCFRGLYVTVKTIPSNTIDIYLLEDKNSLPTVSRDIWTYGARVNGNVSSFDYTGELALQTGDLNTTNSQSAYAYALKAGYTIPSAMNFRLGAEYDFATGDKASTAGKSEAFQNLYPTNHYLYGFTDDIGWSNVKAIAITASIKPTKDLWVGAEYWDYNSEQIRANNSKKLGYEFNLMARYSVNSNVKLEATWARRHAGTAGGNDYYGRAIGNGNDSDLTYLQALVNF